MFARVNLSILIVNWNSKDYLCKCLQSVRMTCSEMSPQIVVVDNASFDGCGEMLAGKFPEAEFIQSSENLGFGQANNLGFQRVRGEFLLLLNPDTELLSGAVARMLEVLRTVPGAGIAAPRLLNSDGSLQTSCVRALPTPLNLALDSELLRRWVPRSSLWGTWHAFHSTQPVEVEAVSGACVLMRSQTFLRVGGFSPHFYMYGEDLDLCARTRYVGLRILHVSTSDVVHHGSGSTSKQLSHFGTVMMRESSETYMRLHYGGIAACRYRVLQAVSAVVRLPFLLVTLGLRPRRRSAIWGSVQKWWRVLMWAIWVVRLRPPPASTTGAFAGPSALFESSRESVSR